jgi:hypothetical protein
MANKYGYKQRTLGWRGKCSTTVQPSLPNVNITKPCYETSIR